LGAWITTAMGPEVLRWVLGVSFIAMAGWMLIPDKIEEDEAQIARRFGVFGATLVTFFLAEMGDKTQLATLALAARYQTVVPVWLGTTAGMMVADGFGILVGVVLGRRIPERLVKWGAALIFIAFGCVGLYEYLPHGLLTPATAAAGLAVVAVAAYFAARRGDGRLPDDQG
jgi:putative Ca2+/H+ antiporter (TMEM165/GDT1 family)